MLRRRGSNDFLALSIELYGTVSPALLGEAQALLELVRPPAAERGRAAGRRGVRPPRRRPSSITTGRSTGDLAVHVEVREDSSGVMVSNGDLLIAPTVSRAGAAGARSAAARDRHARRHLRQRRAPAAEAARCWSGGLRRDPGGPRGLRRVPGRRTHAADGYASSPRAWSRSTRWLRDGPFADVHAHLVDNGVAARGVHDHDAGVPLGRTDQGRRLPAWVCARSSATSATAARSTCCGWEDGASSRAPRRGRCSSAASCTIRCCCRATSPGAGGPARLARHRPANLGHRPDRTA